MQPDPGLLPVSLSEVKAFLRLDRDDEDAELAAMVRTAAALCEGFVGQWLIVRAGSERLPAVAGWQRLSARPVTAITGVADAAGPLPAGAYEADIDAAGLGWVRLAGAVSGSAVTVGFSAGLAMDWNGLAEPLRAGLLRLVAHLYTQRDAADAGPPPAAVAALWRPWRAMRL